MRSTNGYISTLVDSVVSWKSTLHSIVAFPTTKSEYMAATGVVKKVIWLEGLVEKLSLVALESTVRCDSQSAIYLIKNQRFYEHTKHIDINFHFILDFIEERSIKLEKVTLSQMITLQTCLLGEPSCHVCTLQGLTESMHLLMQLWDKKARWS